MPCFTGLNHEENFNLMCQPSANRMPKRVPVETLHLFEAIQAYASTLEFRAEATAWPDMFNFYPLRAEEDDVQTHEPIAAVCRKIRNGVVSRPLRRDELLEPADEVDLRILYC
jgi:hypothetical protein